MLETEHAIIQAPMAGVQGVALAAAVATAGGMGSLPAAMLTPDVLRAQLRELRAATSAPFNVNFFCHTPPVVDAAREQAWRERLAPYYAELGVELPPVTPAARAPFDDAFCDVIVEAPPAVVSFHFGLPAPELVTRVQRAGAKVWSSATTVDEARWLAARGVDAIIAQGAEAGGHRGMFMTGDVTTQLGTFALVPQVVAAVGTVPVIAAGGIADARGVAAARALGATAVQVGTAFLLCPEATTSAVHRAALAGDGHTAITNVFTGRPARAIVNRLVREVGAISGLAPAFPLAAAAVMPLRAAAEPRGSGDFSPLWSGQNRTGCAHVPAAQIVRMLADR